MKNTVRIVSSIVGAAVLTLGASVPALAHDSYYYNNNYNNCNRFSPCAMTQAWNNSISQINGFYTNNWYYPYSNYSYTYPYQNNYNYGYNNYNYGYTSSPSCTNGYMNGGYGYYCSSYWNNGSQYQYSYQYQYTTNGTPSYNTYTQPIYPQYNYYGYQPYGYQYQYQYSY